MKVFVNLDDAKEKQEFMEEQRRIRQEIERRWQALDFSNAFVVER